MLTARNPCLSRVQNAGHAGERRHGAEVRHLSRVYPIKDDIR